MAKSIVVMDSDSGDDGADELSISISIDTL